MTSERSIQVTMYMFTIYMYVARPRTVPLHCTLVVHVCVIILYVLYETKIAKCS